MFASDVCFQNIQKQQKCFNLKKSRRDIVFISIPVTELGAVTALGAVTELGEVTEFGGVTEL